MADESGEVEIMRRDICCNSSHTNHHTFISSLTTLLNMKGGTSFR